MESIGLPSKQFVRYWKRKNLLHLHNNVILFEREIYKFSKEIISLQSCRYTEQNFAFPNESAKIITP